MQLTNILWSVGTSAVTCGVMRYNRKLWMMTE